MRFHPLRIAAVEPLCSTAAALTFEVPTGAHEAFAFQAGQWIGVRRVVEGREERRPYSLADPPGGPLRIGVRATGPFSSWLVHDARVGDKVDVSEPAGAFGSGAIGGRAVCVAAGSGVTPVLSVATTLLRDPRTRLTLVLVDRDAESEMFSDEIDALAANRPRQLEVVRLHTRSGGGLRPDAASWRRLFGSLGPLSGVTGVWLCGPQSMVAELRVVLAESGVPPRRVHTELYAVDDLTQAPAGAGVSTVTLTAEGRTSVVSMPRDAWILDSALEARGDVPFSCKGGMCGACRALLLVGEVDMRANHFLSAADAHAGAVLTCRARPVSDTVVLDFDR